MLDLTGNRNEFYLGDILAANSSQTSQMMLDEQRNRVGSLSSMPSFSSGSLKKKRKSNPQSFKTRSKLKFFSSVQLSESFGEVKFTKMLLILEFFF